MRILVTGGAGYIGSVLTEHLAESHDVVVFDDLSTGHADAVDARATFVRGDVRDTEAAERVLREWRIEAVVHLAGRSEVGPSVLDPAPYFDHNVKGSLALLEAMRRVRVNVLVFSSSAAVYGNPLQTPIPEEHRREPTSPYGASKLCVEHLLAGWGDAYGLRQVSLRYFNAAGASALRGERHDPENHLIPRLLQGARNPNFEITLHGDDYPTPDGTCVRDYVHVLDLASAHAAALDALFRGAKLPAALNVGAGRGHSVREVLSAVERVTGRKVRASMGPRRAGDPAQLVAAADRIEEALAWRAENSSLDAMVASAWRLL